MKADYINDFIDELECRLENRNKDILEYEKYLAKNKLEVKEITETLRRIKDKDYKL